MMHDIQITPDAIEIRMQGWYVFWAFRKRVTIPLRCVVDVYAKPADLKAPFFREIGTALPGVIISGSYVGKGRKEFWNIRYRPEGLVMDLQNHKFTRVVLDVEQAQRWITEIRSAAQLDQ